MDTKLLKQKILDLAIRGKLVPQNPADEPASVLLERIKAEKAQLIKDGKIKKEKAIKDERSNVSEILFDIPSTWCWCQLSSILTDTNAGKSPRCENRPKQSDEWGVIKTTAIQEGYFLANENKVLPKSFVILENQIIYQGDILITRAGPSNRTGIICYVKDEVTNMILSDKTVRLDYIRKTINPEYITYVLNSCFGKKQIIDISVGMADCQVNISQDNIKKLWIPIPPLAEQKRIVAEINRWFKCIDELEQNQQDLHTAIQQAKSKILDLAIHGKLVPQDPNDEPAYVLLDRIKAEKAQLIKEGKIKKEKPLAPVEEVPFDIPQSWEWCKIKDISSQILYGVSESAKSSGNYKLLRITDIQDNKVNWDTVPYTDFDKQKVDDYLLSTGDILFARTGATVGKSYLVVDTPYPAIYASYLIRVKTSSLLLPNYVKYFFESGYYWEQISDNSIGTGQPNVNGTVLSLLNIPIPPQEEQTRIVSKIEELFAQLDKIEESLS